MENLMFDTLDPPTEWGDFRREVLKTIEGADIDADEEFDLALFTVSRSDEGEVTYVDDMLEELDDDTPMEEVVSQYLPLKIKKNSSKFFAFVFPGFQITESDDAPELMCVLAGALFDMRLFVSEVYRDNQQAELGPWESHKPEDYPNLTLPFRKAITYQSD